MLKRILLLSFVIANISLVFAQGKSSIKFTFVDDKTKEPILDSIFLTLSDSIKINFVPDKDGNYAIKGVDANKYSVKVSVEGYLDKEVKKVVVYSDRTSYLHIPMVSLKETIPKFSFGLDISFDSSKVFHEYTFSNYQDDSLIFLGESIHQLYDDNLKKIKLTREQIEKLYNLVYNYMSASPIFHNGVVKSSNLFIVQFGGYPIHKTISFTDSVNFEKIKPIISLMDSFLEKKYCFNNGEKPLLFPKPDRRSRFSLKDGFYLGRESFDFEAKKSKRVSYSISKQDGKDSIFICTKDRKCNIYMTQDLDKTKIVNSYALELSKIKIKRGKWNRDKPRFYEKIELGVSINSVSLNVRLTKLDYFSDIKEFNKIIKSLNKYVPVELKIDPENIKGMLD